MKSEAGDAGERRVWLLACVAVAGAAAWASAHAPLHGDYANPRCATSACDDPSRALHALVTGDIAGFFHEQPIMGLFSVLLRLPGVAIAHAAGASTLGEYRVGSFLLSLIAGLGGVWLAARAKRGGAGWPASLALLALVGVATMWTNALPLGHPEEPLAAVMTIAAVVCAIDRRPLAAGLLLGAAIGTKEWALLAVAPVLLAAPRSEWIRIGLPAAIVAAAMLLPFAVGDPSAFRSAHAARTRASHTNTPANIWWHLGDKRLAEDGSGAYAVYPKTAVARLARPGTFALALLLAVIYARRRRDAAGDWDALALLALCYLLRDVLDTETFSYHHIPMLMAVPAWEVLGRRRFPVVGLAAMVALQLTARKVAPDLSPDTFNALYLAWTLPLVAYLGAVALRIGPARVRPGRASAAAPA